MHKTWLWLVVALLVAAIVAAAFRGYGIALVGSGYSAEILCGAVFVSGRDQGAVETEDLSGPGLEPLSYFRKQVERDQKRATASYYGLARQTAVFRDGFGCTRIVAERYAPGFDQSMKLIGWSMTKGALNALIGLRVKDGKLAVTDMTLLPEWRKDGDPRRDISLDDLLRMSSGLAFDEGYDDPLGDVTEMLFVKGDMATFAASKPLAHPPGTHWDYSSGTSLIIARILRASFAAEDDYLRYPHQRLFEPLGMRSAVLAPDADGTFAASSFLYATARDFARLGLLFLQDGVWDGQQLLPPDWVVYSRGPARSLPDGSYGAHLWLRLPESAHLGVPPMPEDAYYFLGHDEQIVAIVPSRDLVVVRLGLTQEGGDWDNARDLAPIVQAFPPGEP